MPTKSTEILEQSLLLAVYMAARAGGFPAFWVRGFDRSLKKLLDELRLEGKCHFDPTSTSLLTGKTPPVNTPEVRHQAVQIIVSASLSDIIGGTKSTLKAAEILVANNEMSSAIDLVRSQAIATTRSHDYHDALTLWQTLTTIVGSEEQLTPSDWRSMAECATGVNSNKVAAIWLKCSLAAAAANDVSTQVSAIVRACWIRATGAQRSALKEVSQLEGAWPLYGRLVDLALDGKWNAVIDEAPALIGLARAQGDELLEIGASLSYAVGLSIMDSNEDAEKILMHLTQRAIATEDSALIEGVFHNLAEIRSLLLDTTGAMNAAIDWDNTGTLNVGTPGWAEQQTLMAARFFESGMVREAVKRISNVIEICKESKTKLGPYSTNRRADLLLRVDTDSSIQKMALEEALRVSEEHGYIGWKTFALSLIAETKILDGSFGESRRTLSSVEEGRKKDVLPEIALNATRATVARFCDDRISENATRAAQEHLMWLAQLVGALNENDLPPLAQLQRKEILAIASTSDRCNKLLEVEEAWINAMRPCDAAQVRMINAAFSREDDPEWFDKSVAELRTLGLNGIAARFAEEQPKLEITAMVGGALDNLTPLEATTVVNQGTIRRLTRGESASLSQEDAVLLLIARGTVVVYFNQADSAGAGVPIVCSVGDILIGNSLAKATSISSLEADTAIALFSEAQLAAAVDECSQFELNNKLGRGDITPHLLDSTAAAPGLSVDRKLSQLLLNLHERFGRPTTRGESLIDARITVSLLAELIGAKRTRTSTVFNEFKAQKVLEMWKGRIVILNLSELRRTAAPHDAETTIDHRKTA